MSNLRLWTTCAPKKHPHEILSHGLVLGSASFYILALTDAIARLRTKSEDDVSFKLFIYALCQERVRDFFYISDNE